jgi:hypothetical protein
MESGSMKTPLVNNQEEARSSSSITCGLLLSTSVAVTGSFVYGCAMSYSSPAQSKIMEELGLSVADVSPPVFNVHHIDQNHFFLLRLSNRFNKPDQ